MIPEGKGGGWEGEGADNEVEKGDDSSHVCIIMFCALFCWLRFLGGE